jgi:hypothetical protein
VAPVGNIPVFLRVWSGLTSTSRQGVEVDPPGTADDQTGSTGGVLVVILACSGGFSAGLRRVASGQLVLLRERRASHGSVIG